MRASFTAGSSLLTGLNESQLKLIGSSKQSVDSPCNIHYQMSLMILREGGREGGREGERERESMLSLKNGILLTNIFNT